MKLTIRSVGITGTQVGCTQRQLMALETFMRSLKVEFFHHGDCVGVDAQAAAIALNIGMHTVAHPPDSAVKRAFAVSTEVCKTKPYIERNKDIVDVSQLMIGVPKNFHEELRSGTWATIRYAKKQNVPIQVIWPDGKLSFFAGRQ